MRKVQNRTKIQTSIHFHGEICQGIFENTKVWPYCFYFIMIHFLESHCCCKKSTRSLKTLSTLRTQRQSGNTSWACPRLSCSFLPWALAFRNTQLPILQVRSLCCVPAASGRECSTLPATSAPPLSCQSPCAPIPHPSPGTLLLLPIRY